MDPQEILNKLSQIEEQAKCTLAEFPKTLTKERLRMIIALARYLRSEIATGTPGGLSLDETRPPFGLEDTHSGSGRA